MVQLQVAIGVELKIRRKTAKAALESLISRMTLQVVFQIKMVFVFVVALVTLVPALVMLGASHYSRVLPIHLLMYSF